MTRFRKNIVFVLTIFSGALLTACSNDPLSDLTYEDTQVFFTNYDKDINFRDYRSFSIVDSVYVVSNQGEGTSLTDTDVAMITGIIQNMRQLGYEYVAPDDNPDVGVTVQLVDNRYLNLVQVPIGGGWGGYWGGWGGYGMGMPSYFTYQQVQELYWIVNMIDFKNPDTTNQELKVIWNAQIRGEGLYETSLVPGMVDQLFSQSGYLQPE